MVLQSMVLAVTAAYAAALAFYPILWLPRAGRWALWLILSTAVALSPCPVPIAFPAARFVVSLVAISLWTKLFDACATSRLVQRRGFASYVAHLPNSLWLVLRRPPNAPTKAADLRILLRMTPAAMACAAVCVALFRLDWSAVPLILEHAAKAPAVVLTVIFAARAAAAAYRLLGGRGLDPMRNPFAARTPADFWRRWNRPAQQFFDEYAFKPVGGFRRPIRATLTAFAASGIVHEYVFGIAAGRVQGWQMLFFMIQGVATAATLRVRPQGWSTVLWMAGTVLFNLLTSVLFFQSVNAVLPFYQPRGG